jgi:hypothetical protein
MKEVFTSYSAFGLVDTTLLFQAPLWPKDISLTSSEKFLTYRVESRSPSSGSAPLGRAAAAKSLCFVLCLSWIIVGRYPSRADSTAGLYPPTYFIGEADHVHKRWAAPSIFFFPSGTFAALFYCSNMVLMCCNINLILGSLPENFDNYHCSSSAYSALQAMSINDPTTNSLSFLSYCKYFCPWKKFLPRTRPSALSTRPWIWPWI